MVWVLLDAGADIQAIDADGSTGMHMAKSAEVAQALLDANAEVRATNATEESALHLVACFDRLEAAEMLLDSSADIQLPLQTGVQPCACLSLQRWRMRFWTPTQSCRLPTQKAQIALHLAAYFDRLEAAEMLLDSSADMQAAATGGRKKCPVRGRRVFNLIGR